MSNIDILCDDDGISYLPSHQRIKQAVRLACSLAYPAQIINPILCIRFADNAVVQQLNAQWRKKDVVTDVLSFPMQNEQDVDFSESLGDIILANAYCKQQAEHLQLAIADHILHLIIHGTLHLLGYNHMEDADAKTMQALEIQAMQQLGLHHPYPLENDAIASH